MCGIETESGDQREHGMKELIDSNWSERTAIVTGAARGLGKAMADALAGVGVTTYYFDIGQDPYADGDGPDTARFLQIDLQSEQDIKNAVQRVGNEQGRVDILVNAAAAPGTMKDGKPWARADQFELDEWEWLHRVNLTAPFLLARESLKWMVANRWGRIINISSRAARTGMAGGAAYASSKAGLLGLTRLLAFEFAEHGVTANAICPGRFPSALADSFPKEIIEAAIKAIPVQRVGNHDEIAATALFLASEGAAYITGATIDVNGGAYMG